KGERQKASVKRRASKGERQKASVKKESVKKESVITHRNIRATDIACWVIPQEYYSQKLLGDYPTRTASGFPLAVRRVMTPPVFAALWHLQVMTLYFLQLIRTIL
ncbi:MAG: hypothetical protein QM537_03150, partial [Candidatus Symbiobacter sp.]|nr:hypothetical protein [Candidatus Symbiobacter sp.]